jgi:cell division protease FtsH
VIAVKVFIRHGEYGMNKNKKDSEKEKNTSNKSIKAKIKQKFIEKFGIIKPKQVLIILVFIGMVASELYDVVTGTVKTSGDITLQEFYDMIDSGDVESVTVNKESELLYIKATNGNTYKAVNPKNDTFILDLASQGIEIELQQKTLLSSLLPFLISLPMLLLFIILITYLVDYLTASTDSVFELLKNKNNEVTFDDIKGMSDTKRELQFVINQMQNYDELKQLGARPCRGIMLYGPPGNGKTMLAKAIAKESGVNFINACGSDFVQMFVGLGAARVRSLWATAEANSPCIIFIDEIDTLGMKRSQKGGSGAETEYNQTLNALLQKMDGLKDGKEILVIGATNRKDTIDEALLRPGRFDRHYYVGKPKSKADREEIVQFYLDKKKCNEDVTVEKAAKLMKGLSGAEIEQVLNEAVMLSLMNDREGLISLRDIDEAAMETLCGGVKDEHKTQVDKNIVSVHESGHALVSLLLGSNVEKISIVPYSSGVGGITCSSNEDDERQLILKSEQINHIKIALGGMIAEDVYFGEHSGGCSNDLEKATQMIYSMLTEQGQSDKTIINENVLVGLGAKQSVSSDTVKECNELLLRYKKECKELLENNKDRLERLKEMMLERETIVDLTLELIDK